MLHVLSLLPNFFVQIPSLANLMAKHFQPIREDGDVPITRRPRRPLERGARQEEEGGQGGDEGHGGNRRHGGRRGLAGL